VHSRVRHPFLLERNDTIYNQPWQWCQGPPAGSLFYAWEIKSWYHPREIFLDDHTYSGVREDHITSSVTAAHRNGGSTRHLLESRR
jgi:hypothetical protein